MNKEPRTTLEEQVEINRQNIESQIPLTDANTTRSTNNETRIEILEASGITNVGKLSDLDTNDKDSIVDAINENNALAKANKAKNESQDIVIDEITQNLQATGSDLAKIEDLPAVTISTTPIFLSSVTIVEDFESDTIGTLIDPAGILTLNTKSKTIQTWNYGINIEQSVGNTPILYIELVNADLLESNPNYVIAQNKIFLDFSGTVQFASANTPLEAITEAGNTRVRAYVNSGSIIISNAIGSIRLTSMSEFLETQFDTKTKSTNNLGGGVTVKDDVLWLSTNKADISLITDIQSDIVDLTNRVTTLEDTATNHEARISANETAIVDLQNSMRKLLRTTE